MGAPQGGTGTPPNPQPRSGGEQSFMERGTNREGLGLRTRRRGGLQLTRTALHLAEQP